jgi:hypothetical protein
MATSYYSEEDAAAVDFSPRERILVAPEGEEVHVRLETAVTFFRTDGLVSPPGPALEVLRRHGAVRVKVQMGTASSSAFPANPLDQVDGSGIGPSGLSVTVQFVGTVDAKDRFLALLRELAGRRVLLAPVGASMKQHNLHRILHVEKLGNVTEVSTALPVKGVSSVFSAEGVKSFLALAAETAAGASILWNVAEPVAWSHWMLGTDRAGDRLAGPERRRSLWIDWQAAPSCLAPHDVQEPCVVSSIQAVQYTARLPDQDSFSLSDVLPGPLQVDAIEPRSSDTLSIQVVRLAANTDEPEQMDWGPACQGSDLRYSLFNDDIATATLSLTGPASLKESCVHVTTEANSQPPVWSVRNAVYRPIGQAASGTFFTTVVNDHEDCAATVSVVQAIPNVVDPVWQSLRIRLGDTSLSWRDLQEHDVRMQEDVLLLSYGHRLAPQTSLSMSLDYEPAFLSIDAFPGDANRGFEIPPVRARFLVDPACTADSAIPPVTLHSTALLVLAPLPDMSMPFNVLSLTCTLYAFVVGSMINMLIKKVTQTVKYRLDPSSKPVSKLDKIRSKLKGAARRLKARLRGSKDGAAVSTTAEKPKTD